MFKLVTLSNMASQVKRIPRLPIAIWTELKCHWHCQSKCPPENKIYWNVTKVQLLITEVVRASSSCLKPKSYGCSDGSINSTGLQKGVCKSALILHNCLHWECNNLAYVLYSWCKHMFFLRYSFTLSMLVAPCFCSDATYGNLQSFRTYRSPHSIIRFM